MIQQDWSQAEQAWQKMTHDAWLAYKHKSKAYRELDHLQQIEDIKAQIIGLEHGLELRVAKLGKLEENTAR